jgi:hypothetical protein
MVEVALVQRGAHPSAKTPNAIQLFKEDIAYQVNGGFCNVILSSELMKYPPKNLKSLHSGSGSSGKPSTSNHPGHIIPSAKTSRKPKNGTEDGGLCKPHYHVIIAPDPSQSS